MKVVYFFDYLKILFYVLRKLFFAIMISYFIWQKYLDDIDNCSNWSYRNIFCRSLFLFFSFFIKISLNYPTIMFGILEHLLLHTVDKKYKIFVFFIEFEFFYFPLSTYTLLVICIWKLKSYLKKLFIIRGRRISSFFGLWYKFEQVNTYPCFLSTFLFILSTVYTRV